MEKEILVMVTDRKCEWFQSSETFIELEENAPIEEFVKKIDNSYKKQNTEK